MTSVTFFSGHLPHFADHLAPIWHAMPLEHRGDFHALGRAAKRAIDLEITPVQKVPRGKELVIVASFEDYRTVNPSPVIMLNHGAGQNYGGDPRAVDHPSYSGGRGRERVVLFLGPSKQDAKVSRKAYPGAKSVGIGVPKLDPFHQGKRDCGARNVPSECPLVAVTFHADVHVCPETRSAYPHYKQALTSLARRQSELPFRFLGHCHPRSHVFMDRIYRQLKMEFEPDPDAVMRRADCLVFDNSSFGYEFASLDKPVVVLNAPWYRRGIHHGLRFWSDIPGIQVDQPDELEPAILTALNNDPRWESRRREVVQSVYSGLTDGRATERAVSAIMQIL